MELYQLETFLAVVKEGSFSKAAAKLYRTQPAVSQAVQKLEAEFETPLLERSTRHVRLTDTGRVVLEYAQRMVNLRDEVPAAVRELKDVRRGRVVLAANEFTVNYLLPLLQNFSLKFPNISIEVKRSLASEIPFEIRQHAVDIGIVSFEPEYEDLETIVIASDPLVLVLYPDHRLSKHREVSVKQLGGEVFVAHNVLSPHRQHVIETFERHRIPLYRKFELPTIEAIKKFVQMKMGIALLPRVTVETEVKNKVLHAVPVKEMRLERKLRLAYRRNARLTYAAEAFLEVVRSQIKRVETRS